MKIRLEELKSCLHSSRAAIIADSLITPSRRMRKLLPVQSTTVDAKPAGELPPSITRLMLPSNWVNTSWALVAAVWPEIFAEDTARGPVNRISARANGWSGIRNPMVGRGERFSGKDGCRETTRVIAPGQKRDARIDA